MNIDITKLPAELVGRPVLLATYMMLISAMKIQFDPIGGTVPEYPLHYMAASHQIRGALDDMGNHRSWEWRLAKWLTKQGS